MKGKFPIDVYRDQVSEIVQSVFETMLKTPVEPTETRWSPRPDIVTSTVFFVGEWKGAALMEFTNQQAFHFTSRLLSLPEASGMNDDVRDAIGELTNMVAGNLKAVLPPGVDLSMPSVVEGSDYSVRICGRNLVDRIPFLTPMGLMWVLLIEMQE